MIGSEASSELGVGGDRWRSPLRTEPRVSPQGLLGFQLGALFHLVTGKELPQCPPPQLSGCLAPAADPQGLCTAHTVSSLEPFSQAIGRKGYLCPLEGGDPGALRADNAPGVTGPGVETQISRREEGNRVFGWGSRLGNVRPVVSK